MAGAKYNYEDEQQFVPSWGLVDLQQGQATIGESPSSAQKPLDWQNEWYFNEEVSSNTAEVYSTNGLVHSGR